MTQAKTDNTGELVRIADDGLVKIDDVTAFRRVERNGVIMVQFMDRDKQRSVCRGTQFVEIPLVLLVTIMELSKKG